MKNGCIVIRNIKSYLCGEDISGIADALADGGYFIDKMFLLSEEDEREFSQTFAECKNFFENVFVVATEEKLASLRAAACGVLKLQPVDGARIEQDKKTFFFLKSGASLAPFVREEVVPYLDAKYAVRHDKMVIRAVGVPAERLKNVLNEAKAVSGDRLAYNVSEKWGDLRLEILYDSDSPKMLIDTVMRTVVGGFNDYIYATEDTPLADRIFEILKLRGLKLSVAESFTGGGVAKRLIEVPGISSVLFESIVAYDNGSKMSRLGVSKYTLMRQGAVSDETAYEMAAGLIASGNCSVSLSTTGIAGPKSDNTGKPVGLCFIAVGLKESVYVYKYIFKGGREDITQRAINQALFLLYKQIK